jgi:hypothetical protein
MNSTSTSLAIVSAITLSFAVGTGIAETTPPPNASQHWAFHAPKAITLPSIEDGWAKTDIDRFILGKLHTAGLAPSGLADARTLIRRMTFDITGLPPSAEEVAAFSKAVAENRDAAISTLIERLLASPRYGERWGRHWLDVARYSDTKGYAYSREERRFVHAPTYRDWVIGAFNRDLPYDRFLLLQMAADQLVAADSPDLAAMGFITGGRRFIGVTHDIIDDRIDVVTRGAMALTVQCARCHDHKYDPISIEDYYSLYGVFHASNDHLIPFAKADDTELVKRQKKFTTTMKKRREEAASRLRARVGDYLAAQLELKKYPEEGFDQILAPEDLIPASVRRWRDFLHTVKDGHPIFAPWFAAIGKAQPGATLNPLVAAAFATPPTSPAEAAARYTKLFADAEKSDAPGAEELRVFLRDPNSPTTVPDTGIVNNDQFFPFAAIEELWKMQGDIERRLIDLGTPAALILKDAAPEPNPRVFKRGSPSRPGDEVPRQFLEVFRGEAPAPFANGSGRLELAQKIASAENPLTARVMVNRIWQHHFGTGLVKTPSDFGLRAEPPSHPELLDWLARQFIAAGWSMKAIHRQILSSAVYQQAGGTSVSERDPENRLLARFPVQRLEFEQLRDAMLAVSGELDLANTGKSDSVLEPANKRRTVFAYVDRQFLPGVLRTFDFANPDIHVAVRHQTTVPQQALFFLNGTFSADRARTLAAKLPDGDEARVTRLHQLLFQRQPTAAELDAAKKFIAAATSEAEPAQPPRKVQWLYGTGEYDTAAKRLKSFTPLPHFTGESWQGASAWPGGETGWAQLTADGGHPGNTLQHACVRRWVAPTDCAVDIAGTLKHEPEQGDGVRGFIVHSRLGELKAATVHQSTAAMTATAIDVKAGDTIDFIVDIGGTLSYDQFLWAPTIKTRNTKWDALAEFGGAVSRPPLLTPWEQYAQVLLLANEFAFLD